MKLKGLIGNKNTVFVDPLEEASQLAAGATNLFVEAYDQLEQSNTILTFDLEDSKDIISEMEARVKRAEQQLANNEKVKAKLKDFIV